MLISVQNIMWIVCSLQDCMRLKENVEKLASIFSESITEAEFFMSDNTLSGDFNLT